MFVLLALLLGCSDGSDASMGFGVSEPALFDITKCIELSERFVDFGETYPGESVEVIEVGLVDVCGIFDQLDWELDDPDGAFEVTFAAEDLVMVRLVTDEPGEWEAQWRSVVNESDELKGEFRGSVDLQLFATVLSPSD